MSSNPWIDKFRETFDKVQKERPDLGFWEVLEVEQLHDSYTLTIKKKRPDDLFEKVAAINAPIEVDEFSFKKLEEAILATKIEEKSPVLVWDSLVSSGVMDQPEVLLPGGRSPENGGVPGRAEGIQESGETVSNSSIEPPSLEGFFPKRSLNQIEDQAAQEQLGQQYVPIIDPKVIEQSETIRKLCAIVRCADRHIAHGNPLPPHVDMNRRYEIDRSIRSSWESILDTFEIKID